MLREVAAHGGDVADLRRGDFHRGVAQAGEDFGNVRVALDFTDRDERADGPMALLPRSILFKPGSDLMLTRMFGPGTR